MPSILTWPLTPDSGSGSTSTSPASLSWPLAPDASIPAGVPSPATASPLGLDVSTFPDLDPTFGLRSGPRVVAEAVARRLTTPRGGLLGEYGTDIRDFANESITPDTVFALGAAVQAEAESDPRVDSVDVTVTHDPTRSSLSVRVRGMTGEGPFDLVMDVTSLSVEVLLA